MTRLLRLAVGALRPAPGARRIALALSMGLVTHAVFAVAVLAMIWAMYFGMSQSFGAVRWPWAGLINALLVLQFPLVHSLLLTPRGSKWLSRIIPRYGGTLATTTYALIASVQLAMLFLLWTPSGVIWWQANGAVLYWVTAIYAASWMLLIKASYDAGAEVQSGALGWMSLMQKIKPMFPDMPTTGLFRFIRQPIYLSFALTLWTVPARSQTRIACSDRPTSRQARAIAACGSPAVAVPA